MLFIYYIYIFYILKKAYRVYINNYLILLSRGSGVRIPPGSPKISTLLMQGVFYIFIKVKSLDSHFMV